MGAGGPLLKSPLLPAPFTSTSTGGKEGLLCPQPHIGPQPHAAPLTGAGSGREGSPPCASPPGRLGSAPPPASPSCWHTAPCVTGGCPGCWCCPPCKDRGSWAMGTGGTPLVAVPTPRWSSGRCTPLPSTHLLNLRMKILIWLKSGRSAGSCAQQRSISTASSSLCTPVSMEGRKKGFWLLRTFCTISVQQAGADGEQMPPNPPSTFPSSSNLTNLLGSGPCPRRRRGHCAGQSPAQ